MSPGGSRWCRAVEWLLEFVAIYLTWWHLLSKRLVFLIPDESRWSQVIPDDPRWSQMFSDHLRWSKMMPDDPRWFKMIQDDTRWHQTRWIPIMANLYYPRWFQIISHFWLKETSISLEFFQALLRRAAEPRPNLGTMDLKVGYLCWRSLAATGADESCRVHLALSGKLKSPPRDEEVTGRASKAEEQPVRDWDWEASLKRAITWNVVPMDKIKQVCMYNYIYMYADWHIYMKWRTSIHMIYIYTYIYIYTCTYVYIYIHMYIHIVLT